MENENKEISHQQSLVKDSFSTIERLESEMATVSREFESLNDDNQETNTVEEIVEQKEEAQ